VQCAGQLPAQQSIGPARLTATARVRAAHGAPTEVVLKGCLPPERSKERLSANPAKGHLQIRIWLGGDRPTRTSATHEPGERQADVVAPSSLDTRPRSLGSRTP